LLEKVEMEAKLGETKLIGERRRDQWRRALIKGGILLK
jgi:hypothetical protein